MSTCKITNYIRISQLPRLSISFIARSNKLTTAKHATGSIHNDKPPAGDTHQGSRRGGQCYEAYPVRLDMPEGSLNQP